MKDLRREATALKEVVADRTLENRLLKKVWLAPSALLCSFGRMIPRNDAPGRRGEPFHKQDGDGEDA